MFKNGFGDYRLLVGGFEKLGLDAWFAVEKYCVCVEVQIEQLHFVLCAE